MGRKKDTTRRAPGKRAQLKLSDPRNVRRLRALYDGEDAGDLVDWVVQLVNSAGADERHPRVFPLAVRLAAEVVEATPPRRATRGEPRAARDAYDHLADILARTQAGETLAEIEAKDVAARLRARAEAVINDPSRYDPDTREAVKRSLAQDDAATLGEIVKRAEAGDTVCDLTGAQEASERGAAAVLSLMQNPDVSIFITRGVLDALERASGLTGVKFSGADTGD